MYPGKNPYDLLCKLGQYPRLSQLLSSTNPSLH
jgi:hypothetical protein